MACLQMQEQSESFFVSSSQTRDSAAKVERAQQKLGMFSLLAKQTQISPGLWNTWEQVTESPSPQHLRERFREQIARSQLLHQRLPPQRFLDPPDLALSERGPCGGLIQQSQRWSPGDRSLRLTSQPFRVQRRLMAPFQMRLICSPDAKQKNRSA